MIVKSNFRLGNGDRGGWVCLLSSLPVGDWEEDEDAKSLTVLSPLPGVCGTNGMLRRNFCSAVSSTELGVPISANNLS